MRYHIFLKLVAGFLVLACSAEADFTGVYGGAQIGFQAGKTKINSNFYDLTAGDDVPLTSRLSLEGFNGGLHLGYGKKFQNHLYVGGEVGGRFHTTSGSESRVFTSRPAMQKIKVKNNHSFDLSLKVGYVQQNFMPYLKVGVECAHYKIDFGAVTGDLVGSSVSKTLTGFRPAIGFDYLWSPHWVFGFEYAHTFFNKVSHTQPGVRPSEQYSIHKIQPNTGVALLKVSYKI